MQEASAARGKYERWQLGGGEGESWREHLGALRNTVESARDPELIAKAQRSADHLSDSDFFPATHGVRVDVLREELVAVGRPLPSHANAYGQDRRGNVKANFRRTPSVLGGGGWFGTCRRSRGRPIVNGGRRVTAFHAFDLDRKEYALLIVGSKSAERSVVVQISRPARHASFYEPPASLPEVRILHRRGGLILVLSLLCQSARQGVDHLHFKGRLLNYRYIAYVRMEGLICLGKIATATNAEVHWTLAEAQGASI
mmetsp:Transcript_8596/g.15596  ORF Transcript_8596/g.15596 Transcript_8596/m.15596 type:complete len:256 (+) Transcript_8596:2006-2773(+)